MQSRRIFLIAGLLLAMFTDSAFTDEPAKVAMTNPFYAMDTSFNRKGVTVEQQLDLVKELGFAGIAGTESTPEAAAALAEKCEKRGLKLHAIYCGATVTADGELASSATLIKTIESLKGRGTIIWLHISGSGPAIGALTGNEPLFKTLRDLADAAAVSDLHIAIYPHITLWAEHFGDAVKLAKLVNHPRFGVSFNLCHALAVGDEEKIPALLDEGKSVLVTVTINGADTGVKGGRWKQLIQPLGSGTYDTGIVLRKLKEIGFTGPIGFQGYGLAGDPRAILTPTMEAWRKLTAAEPR